MLETDRGGNEVSGGRVVEEEKEVERGGGRAEKDRESTKFNGVGDPVPARPSILKADKEGGGGLVTLGKPTKFGGFGDSAFVFARPSVAGQYSQAGRVQV